MIPELFKLTFMQHAFLAGAMLSVVLAVVSFFVVLRRLSFIGAGVAHSAFGGVALGALLGISPTLTAVAFAVAVSNAIGYIGNRGKLSTDTAIGIFFSLSMALGVIFIGLSKQYNIDLFGYLFLLTILALSVVISIKIVGIVLVSALLVIPGAAALQLTNRYPLMIATSIAVALTATTGGLFISYYADIASGATIVTLASAFFFGAFVIGRIRK